MRSDEVIGGPSREEDICLECKKPFERLRLGSWDYEKTPCPDCTSKALIASLEEFNPFTIPVSPKMATLEENLQRVFEENERYREALELIHQGGFPSGVCGTVEDRMLEMCRLAGVALGHERLFNLRPYGIQNSNLGET